MRRSTRSTRNGFLHSFRSFNRVFKDICELLVGLLETMYVSLCIEIDLLLYFNSPGGVASTLLCAHQGLLTSASWTRIGALAHHNWTAQWCFRKVDLANSWTSYGRFSRLPVYPTLPPIFCYFHSHVTPTARRADLLPYKLLFINRLRVNASQCLLGTFSSSAYTRFNKRSANSWRNCCKYPRNNSASLFDPGAW